MKILELNILEFGGLKDRSLSLSEGLNLLEGENEAGKSTVWLFIKFMLYGLPKKGQEDRVRSVSRDGHAAKGVMRICAQGEEYSIERSFVEGARSASERVSVLRLRDGAELYEGVNPGETFLGVPKEVFESSCGIGQSQSAAPVGKKSMDAIRNLLSTADERVDVSKMLERLDRVRVGYRHKNGKGGRVVELAEEKNRLKQQYAVALETQERLSALRAKLTAGDSQMAELRRQQSELGDLLSQIGFHQILLRFDSLAESRSELAQVQEERRSLAARELKTEYVPNLSYVANLQGLSGQVEEAENRLAAQRERKEELVKTNNFKEEEIELGKKVAQMGGAQGVSTRVRAKKKAQSGLAVGGFLGLAAGVLSFFLLPFGLPARLGGLVVGCALGIALLVLSIGNARVLRTLAQELRTTVPKLEAEALAYESAYQKSEEWQKALLEIETQIRLSKSYLDEGLVRLTKMLILTLPESQASATAERGRAEAARLEAFLKADQALARREELLQSGILKEESSLAEYDAEALRGQVSPGVREMTAVQIQRAEMNRKMLGSRMEALEESLRQTRIEEISLAANAKDPLVIADELEAVREKHRRAEAYADSLELAIGALGQAADAMSGSITPALSKAASAMMERISGGRYGELRASNDLSVTLLGVGGQSVPTELMSGGTRDAAYLSLRVALMTQVFGGELPPLMMDESLCQMDDGRAELMLSLLSELCADGLQCLLFTCHKRESEISRRRGFAHQHITL